TSMNTNSFGYRTEPKIHTVKKSRQPKKAWDKDGNNILSLVKKVDNKPAPADKIADDYYIFDFGKIKDTANVKLLIDGWTAFGLTGMPANRTVLQPYVEVVDALGNWQKVQVLGIPAGDLKTVVVDLSGLFLHPEDHRIRLNTGLLKSGKFIVDRVSLDVSPPAAVTTRLLTASSADLQHPGRPPFASAKLDTRIQSSDEVMADVPEAYFYGAFTRLGEVKELLAATDDKFVIMRHGDELTITFPALLKPALGYKRSYLLLADLYYKGGNTLSVDPLPFHAMSSYPYPATESYPQDADHQTYLQNYNTRICSKPAFPTQGLAADWGGAKITLA
ncbi:MAG: hypothetical protein HZC44_01815, partial [Geobacter sp.]|nr:hypothetical protein [Geobacter sp.]